MKVDKFLSGLGLSGDILIIILLLVIIYYLHLINENLIVEGMDPAATGAAAAAAAAAGAAARGGAAEAVGAASRIGEVENTVNRVTHGGGITLDGMSPEACRRQCSIGDPPPSSELVNTCTSFCTAATMGSLARGENILGGGH